MIKGYSSGEVNMEELWYQMNLKKASRSCEGFLGINQNTKGPGRFCAEE